MHTFHSITTLYVFVREWNDAAVVPVRQVSFYSRKNDTELLFVRTLVVLIAVRCIFVMKLLNLKLLNYLFCNNGCNFVNVGTMPEQCKVSYIGSTSFRCLQNSSQWCNILCTVDPDITTYSLWRNRRNGRNRMTFCSPEIFETLIELYGSILLSTNYKCLLEVLDCEIDSLKA